MVFMYSTIIPSLLGVIGTQELFLIVFIILPAALFFWSLVDIVKNDFEGNNKLVWLLLVILLPFIGTILYLGIGYRQKINK